MRIQRFLGWSGLTLQYGYVFSFRNDLTIHFVAERCDHTTVIDAISLTVGLVIVTIGVTDLALINVGERGCNTFFRQRYAVQVDTLIMLGFLDTVTVGIVAILDNIAFGIDGVQSTTQFILYITLHRIIRRGSNQCL